MSVVKVEKGTINKLNLIFLAALSSSRRVVVGRSVGRSVGPSVGKVCEKVTFSVLIGNSNLPTYLPMRQ